MGLDGLHAGIGLSQARDVIETKQAWHGRSVDIGVKQTDLEAFASQRDGEIGGHRRLADTPLA